MEQELFICECGNVEHQIVFSWFEDDDYDVTSVYATVHLRKKPFLRRLIYGLKYIFGYQCKYGAFDEFVFSPDDASKLKRIYSFLDDEAKRESLANLEKAYKEGSLPLAVKTNNVEPANTQGND